MPLYFVRHGESEANIKGVFAGQRNNAPLTKLGEKQAINTAKKLRKQNLRIDRIVSSPLIRATQTAEIIAKIIGFATSNITIDPRIAEYDMGVLSGQPVQEVTTQKLINAPGSEDIYVFQKRVLECYNDLRNLSGNTLLVCHTNPGRIITANKKGLALRDFRKIPASRHALVIEI